MLLMAIIEKHCPNGGSVAGIRLPHNRTQGTCFNVFAKLRQDYKKYHEIDDDDKSAGKGMSKGSKRKNAAGEEGAPKKIKKTKAAAKNTEDEPEDTLESFAV